MATAVMSREDGDTALNPQSRDVSPHSTPYAPGQADGTTKEPNGYGYMHSPLRSSQRANGAVTEEDLPDVPRGEIGGARPASGVRFNSADFPSQGQSRSQDVTSDGVLNGMGSGDVSVPLVTRKRVQIPGTETPMERKSVQFARGTADEDATTLPATSSWGTEDGANEELPVKERQGSFFGKLRAFAGSSGSSGHVRQPSSTAGSATPNVALSPQSERSEPYYPVPASDGADVTIEEAEESERDIQDEDGTAVQPRQRRAAKRPRITNPSESSPSTPKHGRFESRFASFIRDQSSSHDGHKSSNMLRRRHTLSEDESDAEGEANGGVSEDEGKDRIKTAWRRGIEGARGLSYAARKPNENQSPDARRPGHLRRITNLAGGHNAADGTTGSPFRAKVDRQTTSSAQKWRQVKAGLKMLGQRKKDERMRVDHQKSAQLMAELLAGAPAALVFASMFQRDENNHRKIPVLLEQLKIRIPDSGIRSRS
jgi:phospholipase D1/2